MTAYAVSDQHQRPSKAFRIAVTAIVVFHLALAVATGLRWEHVAGDAALVAMLWSTPRVSMFGRVMLPGWLTGALFDNQRLLPVSSHVHTGDVHAFEAAVFPNAPGGLIWPEWFNAHPHAVLDLFCGAAYALFLYELFAAGIYFYFVERTRAEALMWAFLLANVAGVLFYIAFPTAPPWYIIAHGTGPADPTALPSAAGCARFDALLGIHYFQSFYGRNPIVFGAMPSLHVSYPAVVTWYTWSRGWKWRVPCLAFLALVAFSAVYLAHHYIVDVVVGIGVGFGACALVDWAVRRYSLFSRAGASPSPVAYVSE